MLGGKCKIVVFDWLEDCLIGKRLQKKLIVEKPYTLDRTIKRIEKGKRNQTKYRAQFEDGARIAKELVDNSNGLSPSSVQVSLSLMTYVLF